MFGSLADQVFSTGDLGKVAFLVLLEALLSADNALIMAIMVRHLPKNLQRKALFYGMAGAFTFRLGAIILAQFIISLWWIQVVGAIYLVYLMVKHFIKVSQSDGHTRTMEGTSFWMTVAYVELSDLAFAIDSILVAVAIEPRPQKLWVVYAGAVVGIVLLRFISGVFLRILEKYPVLDHVAYVLVGWAGVKLCFLGGHTFEKWYDDRNPAAKLPFSIPELHPAAFWGGMVVIVASGIFMAMKAGPLEEEVVEVIEEKDLESLQEQS